jgi:hypothetical protein
MKHRKVRQDLNFKVSPEMHQAFKATAALRDITMVYLLEESFQCYQEKFGDEQTRSLMPPKSRAKNRLVPPRSRDFLDC